jgi:chloride channel 3/4/5
MGPSERASKVQHVRQDVMCSFAAEDPHAEEDVPSLSTPGIRSAGPMVAIEDELSAEVVESTSTRDVIKFWPWVQQVMSTQTFRIGGVVLTQPGTN